MYDFKENFQKMYVSVMNGDLTKLDNDTLSLLAQHVNANNTAINSDGIDHTYNDSMLLELKKKMADLNEKLQALDISNCNNLKHSNLASITQHIDAHNSIIGAASDMHDEV